MNNLKTVSATVPTDIAEWLDKKVNEDDCSIARIIRRILRTEMEKEGYQQVPKKIADLPSFVK